jgi:hypothetical protein
MQKPVRPSFAIAAFASVLFAASTLVAGALLPAYSQLLHPVVLLGANGVPGATAFNLLGFVLPGLLAAWVAHRFRGHLDGAPWAARIGAQALLLSALAFAGQALLPLELGDVEAAGNRLQGAVWTLWWLATLVAGVLVAVGTRKASLAGRGRALALLGVAVVVFALLAPSVLPAGLAQRLAVAAWWLAVLLVSRVSRDAA